jgi:hypothetical protein
MLKKVWNWDSSGHIAFEKKEEKKKPNPTWHGIKQQLFGWMKMGVFI